MIKKEDLMKTTDEKYPLIFKQDEREKLRSLEDLVCMINDKLRQS